MKNNLDLKNITWRAVLAAGWLLFPKFSLQTPSGKPTL